jgi:hypothetical protein
METHYGGVGCCDGDCDRLIRMTKKTLVGSEVGSGERTYVCRDVDGSVYPGGGIR